MSNLSKCDQTDNVASSTFLQSAAWRKVCLVYRAGVMHSLKLTLLFSGSSSQHREYKTLRTRVISNGVEERKESQLQSDIFRMNLRCS